VGTRVEQISLNDLPAEAKIAVKEYNQNLQKLKEERDRKYNHNSEVQRNRLMSKEQRGRNAIDLMTKSQKEYLSNKLGRDVTHAEAESAARAIAKKAHGQDY
jgi:hypothetical protein